MTNLENLEARAKAIGNISFFPQVLNIEYLERGISYRDYLIGQALTGFCIDHSLLSSKCAENAISTADMCLVEMAGLAIEEEKRKDE